MYKFPNGFYWGSSTSGPQTEGRVRGDGKGDNNWDYWYKREPYKFHNEIGPENTSTFYTHYLDDIDLLKETGHNIFRTSIQWSRLYPNGDGELNQRGVDFYRQVFKKIKDKNIKLMINLYHFDLPYKLQLRGGWENKETIYLYQRYAKACFELFGEFVDYWATFNEPIVPVEMGYLHQYHLPMKIDAEAAVQVAYNTQLASSLAVRTCHTINENSKIGIILNLSPVYPRSQHPADIKAAQNAELLQSRSFLDPSVLGEYPKELVELLDMYNLLPDYTEEELEIIKDNRIDYLGVNYYQPLRVKAPIYQRNSEAPITLETFFETYEMPGRKMNPYRGWEIYEPGIYDIGQKIKNDYNNIDWILTENGMGVESEERFKKEGIVQDDYRIEYIKGHLKELHRTIKEGSNCHGYMLWTFIDCWSWMNAYKNRYGLIELDLKTQKRTIKKSGYWFKQLSEENGFKD